MLDKILTEGVEVNHKIETKEVLYLAGGIFAAIFLGTFLAILILRK